MRTILRVTNIGQTLNKRQRQLTRLFMDQGGLCCYCKEPMILRFGHQRHKPEDPRRATLEHLDDRFSPMRGKRPGELRHAAACYECNGKKALESQRAQPIELLRAVAGRRPGGWVKYTRSERRAIRALGYRIYQRAFTALLAREETEARQLYAISEELDKIAGFKWRHRPGQVTEFSKLAEIEVHQ